MTGAGAGDVWAPSVEPPDWIGVGTGAPPIVGSGSTAEAGSGASFAPQEAQND
jgi:hypothetical protein